jgi:RNA polymerase sigma factor (TIGR02999 family)
MDEVTQVLNAIEQGDAGASAKLLPLVYEELRRLAATRLAAERPGQTLQATALVHEAYLRLVGSGASQTWDHRGHFFAAAAEAMRRILIENARRKKRIRHGGQLERLDQPLDELAGSLPDEQLLDLDEALQSFESKFSDKAAVIKLRFFAGLTNEQTAQILGISPATVQRHWTFARAWLFTRLGNPGTDVATSSPDRPVRNPPRKPD